MDFLRNLGEKIRQASDVFSLNREAGLPLTASAGAAFNQFFQRPTATVPLITGPSFTSSGTIFRPVPPEVSSFHSTALDPSFRPFPSPTVSTPYGEAYNPSISTRPASPTSFFSPPEPPSSSQSNPYAAYSAQGIPVGSFGPIRGLTGETGYSTNSLSTPSLPAQAPTGQTGSSSFRGLLGAVGGGGTLLPSGGAMTEEDKRRQQAVSVQNPALSGFIPGLTPNYTPGLSFTPSTPPPARPAPFNISGGTQPINPSEVRSTASQMTEQNPSTVRTLTDIRDSLQNRVNGLLQEIQTRQGNQGQPVVPTNDELVKNSPDPAADLATLKQIPTPVLDDVLSKYKVTQTLDDITNMQNRIEAETKAYQAEILDIKNDPNLPKRLAERRIKLIQDAQSTNLQALTVQYGFLKDTYDLRLGLAKEELGLQRDRRNELERQQDNQRGIITEYIRNGALLSFTDNQLKQIASLGLGYDFSGLKAMSDALKSQNAFKIAQAEATLQRTVQATNLANIKTVRGGLYDLRTGEWIVAPKATGTRGTFSNAQLNKGAAVTGVSRKDFSGFDEDAQNFAINQSAAVTQAFKQVDSVNKAANANPKSGQQLRGTWEKEISESVQFPSQIKDALVRRLYGRK